MRGEPWDGHDDGPDDRVASKVAVGIVPFEGGEVHQLERWIAPSGDVRDDDGIAVAALAVARAHGARSIGIIDGWSAPPGTEAASWWTTMPCRTEPARRDPAHRGDA